MKKITIIGVIIVVLIIILSVSNKVEEAAMQEGPIKIGFIGPLTGDGAAYGEPAQRITQIAVDEINANGGIDGRQLEVIYEDGKCSGKDAATAAQKLINVDGVQIITGMVCSGEALAITPILDTSGVFGLATAASSPDLTGVSKNFARVYPSDAGQAKVLAEYASEQGYKKVGVFFETTEYATASKNAFVDSFVGEIIAEGIVTGATDSRTSISKIISADVDAVYVTVQSPATADKVFAQLQTSGLNTPLIVDAVVSTSPETIKTFPDYLMNSVSANVVFNGEGSESLNTTYVEKYDAEIPFKEYMIVVYDAVYMLADAFEEVGTEPQEVRNWVYGRDDWKGASGSIDIDEFGDRLGEYLITKFNGTEYVGIVE